MTDLEAWMNSPAAAKWASLFRDRDLTELYYGKEPRMDAVTQTDAEALDEQRRIANLTQAEYDAANAGYTTGDTYAPTSPLARDGTPMREVALAIATQLASAAAPGDDIAANVIKDAEKYLAFLEGRAVIGDAKGSA